MELACRHFVVKFLEWVVEKLIVGEIEFRAFDQIRAKQGCRVIIVPAKMYSGQSKLVNVCCCCAIAVCHVTKVCKIRNLKPSWTPPGLWSGR